VTQDIFSFDMPLKSGSKTLDDPERIIIHAMPEYVNHRRTLRHNTVGEPNQDVIWAHEYFRAKNISTHVIITPSGIKVRTRQDDQGAYHASGLNDIALGLTFLVPGVHTEDTFREAIETKYLSGPQFKAGVEQVRAWLETYTLIEEPERHSHVVRNEIDPGRGFPWFEFLEGCGV